MKILLTGVGGFIGTYLYNSLLKNGYDILGLSRSKAFIHKNSSDELIYSDLSEGLDYDEDVDVIVHAAAKSPDKGVDIEDYISDNILATRNLVRYAKNHCLSKFIYLSSISIYGDINTKFVDEWTSIVDPDMYGMTKFISEKLVFSLKDDISVFSLRLPGVLGAKSKRNWLSKVAKKLLKNKDVVIYNPEADFNNMILVSDLSVFINYLIRKQFVESTVFTLSCKSSLKIREVVHLLKELLDSNSKIIIKKKKKNPFTISNRKAIEFGFKPLSAEDTLRSYSKDIQKGMKDYEK